MDSRKLTLQLPNLLSIQYGCFLITIKFNDFFVDMLMFIILKYYIKLFILLTS